jgi:type I restriction enzyme S subunit
MEVRPGYKQTEVGVIPADWDRVVVGAIASIKGGKRLPPGYALIDTPTPHPYVRVSDMRPGGVDTSAIKYVPEAASPAIQNYRIYDTDIFISVAGTLGIVGVVPPELDGANLTENADRLTELRCDRDYLMYWLLSRPVQRMIESIRTVGAQPKLALGRIAQFDIALPRNAAEQRDIAVALSDMDALLDGLDRLIAKKRDLKQAATQQLLTGQTRLPGFDDEWKVKRVLELGEVVTGGTPRTDVDEYWGDTYPWVTPTDISTNRDMFSSERWLTQRGLDAVRRLPANTVLVTCIASIGKNAILRTTGACNQQINAVIPDRNSNAVFLYYLFEASKHYLLANAGVTATSIISKAAFSELTFRVPLLEEQVAIGAVLSDIDDELAALEGRRNKTRDLKQAMMQELLTGKTRLVPAEAAHA